MLATSSTCAHHHGLGRAHTRFCCTRETLQRRRRFRSGMSRDSAPFAEPRLLSGELPSLDLAHGRGAVHADHGEGSATPSSGTHPTVTRAELQGVGSRHPSGASGSAGLEWQRQRRARSRAVYGSSWCTRTVGGRSNGPAESSGRSGPGPVRNECKDQATVRGQGGLRSSGGPCFDSAQHARRAYDKPDSRTRACSLAKSPPDHARPACVSSSTSTRLHTPALEPRTHLAAQLRSVAPGPRGV